MKIKRTIAIFGLVGVATAAGFIAGVWKMHKILRNDLKITLPPMAEGQTDWNLYSAYQSPVGRNPWPWHHRIVYRALMYLWWKWDVMWRLWEFAQRFREPPMKYETKYHEIKVLKQDGCILTVDSTEYVTDGQRVSLEKPEPTKD